MSDFPLSDSGFTEPPKPNSRKKYIYVLITLAALLLIYFFFLRAPSQFPVGTIIKITEGENLGKVATRLQDEYVIRSRVLFEFFAILYGGERHIIPADYLLDEREAVYTIAWRVTKGERHMPPVAVTIPEGFNLTEIVDAYAAKMSNFNKTKFLAGAKEGYMFPDTYFFLTTDSEQDVLRSMAANFERKVAPLRPSIAAFGKTEKQIITMASLVEKEAKGDQDRGVISGILWRRFSIGMPLQADAAPETYKTKGLPKLPISNPGLEAIQAAIHPVATPYLYYLHDKEGNIHYAKTFEEHKANRLKYGI